MGTKTNGGNASHWQSSRPRNTRHPRVPRVCGAARCAWATVACCESGDSAALHRAHSTTWRRSAAPRKLAPAFGEWNDIDLTCLQWFSPRNGRVPRVCRNEEIRRNPQWQAKAQCHEDFVVKDTS